MTLRNCHLLENSLLEYQYQQLCLKEDRVWLHKINEERELFGHQLRFIRVCAHCAGGRTMPIGSTQPFCTIIPTPNPKVYGKS